MQIPGSTETKLRGQRLGPYRIGGVLGSGGMGVVFDAERVDDAFHQRVAIKVLRDSDDVSPARLVAERQILASLDHPAIARLIDGGVTEEGRPYLVMERVEGEPVDRYCERLELPVRARLELFLQVLAAVQHAHGRLVLHRDLKPANILVIRDGRPKLLDFGIARFLDLTPAGPSAPPTRNTAGPLTPAFASPEQLRGDPLTTASDVYSLGMVLHVLLTGRVPDRHASASGDHLPHDLRAICLKAVREEPEHRYPSAEALARDIEAFLAGHLVLAHRGSRWYRLRKLARQHRGAALAGTLLVAGVVAGTTGALWQASIAGRERDRARGALLQAEQLLAHSTEVGGFLAELFRSSQYDGRELTIDELLRLGQERADALAGRPAVQARMLDVVGQLHHRVGRHQDAAALLTRAYELRRATLGPDHPDLAETLLNLARLRRSQGNRTEARRLTEEALRVRRASLAPNDIRIAEVLDELTWYYFGMAQEQLVRTSYAIYVSADADVRHQVRMLRALSTNLKVQGKLDDALEADRRALELAQSRLGPTAITTGYTMIHLADQVSDIAQDYAEAERLYRTGLEIQMAHEGRSSPTTIHGLHSLAELLGRQGRLAEAEQLLRRAYRIRVDAEGPRHTGPARELAMLARNLARQGRAAEARAAIAEALGILEESLGRSHAVYADGLRDLAAVHAHLGHADSAVAVQRAAMAHESTRAEGQHAVAHRHLGWYLLLAQRFEEAEAAMLYSLTRLQEIGSQEGAPVVLEGRRALFELYTAWGRPEDAARYRVAHTVFETPF